MGADFSTAPLARKDVLNGKAYKGSCMKAPHLNGVCFSSVALAMFGVIVQGPCRGRNKPLLSHFEATLKPL